MAHKDIGPERAEILSVILEGLFYGASLPMFAATIWTLWSQRSTRQVNLKMFTVACLLLLLSTMHFVIHIIRLMKSLESYWAADPGGRYYLDAPEWTFVSIHYVYTVQTLIGDGVVLYRCYAVWKSKLVMVLPVLLFCTVVATGIASPYIESQVGPNQASDKTPRQWMTAFWVLTLTTNLLTTLLLASRIWFVNRETRKLHGPRKSQLQPILHIIVDAGMIYTLTLVVTLICYLCGFDFQYVMEDIITPIITITFYLVIIRVGLANRANNASNFLALGYTSTSNVMDRRSGMQVHVATCTESKVEDGQRSVISPILVDDENNYRSKIKFDEIRVGV